MSSDQNKYSLSQLIGKADLPRDANPSIRGAIRREDPDANPAPHFTGLSGTSLTLDYSPTGVQVINFVSDDFDLAINAINAVDALNLEASDENGYLRLRSLSGGSKNYLKVMSGDAAPILGLQVDPLPGSASYAGEVSTAPPGAQSGQSNPQGTALVAADEDLSSASINRAIVGALLHAERAGVDLDLETLTIQEVAVTVQDHPVSGERVFRIEDDSIRIPIRGFGVAVSNPADGLLDNQFQLMEVAGGQSQEFIELTNAEFYGRVTNVYYDDLTNTLNGGTSFATWGTPDGRSIFGKLATDIKHAATAISGVYGDIVTVAGATFVTLSCSPGDTVLIAGATNNDPFNHDGEFVITEVISEEIVRLRPKSEYDQTYSSTETPRGLNEDLPGGTAYGTLAVLIGDYINASSLVFEVGPTTVPASSAVRMIVGRSSKDMRLPASDAAMPALTKNGIRMAELLRTHAVTAAGLRHGSDHIDGTAVGGVFDTLTSDTVEAQLAEIIGHLNTLIAAQVSYAGGPFWRDDTPNPATTVEAQLDKIIFDLGEATVDGANKISALATGDLTPNGSVRSHLTLLDTLWLKLSRANTVSGIQTFTAANLFQAVNLFSKTQRVEPDVPNDPALRNTVVPTLDQYNTLFEGAAGPEDAKLVRLMYGFDGRIVMTINAGWDTVGEEWSSDVSASESTMMTLTDSGMILSYNAPTASTWSDGAWDSKALEHYLVPRVAEIVSATPPARTMWRDEDGNDRFSVDHLGFPSARVTTFIEDWIEYPVGVITPANIRQWAASVAVGGLIQAYDVAGSSYPSPYIMLRTVGGVGDNAFIATRSLFEPSNDTVAVMEFMCGGASPAGVGSKHIGLAVGNPLLTVDKAVFEWETSDGNWYANTGDGTTETRTLLAIGGGGYLETFRIELHGANTPGGARAVFLHNGTIVAIHTTNLPRTTANLNAAARLQQSTAAGGIDFPLGRIQVSWNGWTPRNLDF